MHSVLVVSPYFPPMSVVGAKRPLCLARNLPRFGWSPVVLASDPARENVDPSLEEAVPQSLLVSRGYTAPLRHLFSARRRARRARPREARVRVLGREMPLVWPFDPYLADAPAGLREALRLVERHAPAAIHVCADPFSAFLVGMVLRRRTSVPLVLDLRDPWSLHPGRRALRPALTRAAIEAVEAAAFRAASKIVLNTAACRDEYALRYRGRVPEERFTAIRNAFDDGLFAAGPSERSRAFVVTHFGWFRRFVPSDPLLEGFARFVTRERLSPLDAQLRCVGGLRPEDERRVRWLGLDGFVDARPAVPYRQTRTTLEAADVLAVVVDPRSRLCVPAKIYDYLAARRPILAISDVPEVNRIVESTGAGVAIGIGDPDAVAAALSDYRARKLAGRLEGPAESSVRPFGAVEQARLFAEVLDEVAA